MGSEVLCLSSHPSFSPDKRRKQKAGLKFAELQTVTKGGVRPKVYTETYFNSRRFQSVPHSGIEHHQGEKVGWILVGKLHFVFQS